MKSQRRAARQAIEKMTAANIKPSQQPQRTAVKRSTSKQRSQEKDGKQKKKCRTTGTFGKRRRGRKADEEEDEAEEEMNMEEGEVTDSSGKESDDSDRLRRIAKRRKSSDSHRSSGRSIKRGNHHDDDDDDDDNDDKSDEDDNDDDDDDDDEKDDEIQFKKRKIDVASDVKDESARGKRKSPKSNLCLKDASIVLHDFSSSCAKKDEKSELNSKTKSKYTYERKRLTDDKRKKNKDDEDGQDDDEDDMLEDEETDGKLRDDKRKTKKEKRDDDKDDVRVDDRSRDIENDVKHTDSEGAVVEDDNEKTKEDAKDVGKTTRDEVKNDKKAIIDDDDKTEDTDDYNNIEKADDKDDDDDTQDAGDCNKTKDASDDNRIKKAHAADDDGDDDDDDDKTDDDDDDAEDRIKARMLVSKALILQKASHRSKDVDLEKGEIKSSQRRFSNSKTKNDAKRKTSNESETETIEIISDSDDDDKDDDDDDEDDEDDDEDDDDDDDDEDDEGSEDNVVFLSEKKHTVNQKYSAITSKNNISTTNRTNTIYGKMAAPPVGCRNDTTSRRTVAAPPISHRDYTTTSRRTVTTPSFDRMKKTSAPSMSTAATTSSTGFKSSSLSQKTPALDIIAMVTTLQESLAKMKNDYETKLKVKDDQITKLKDDLSLQDVRLKNELEWKNEQIEELTKVAERNVEIEAKINLLLSDKEAYEEELVKISTEKDRVTISSSESDAGDDEDATKSDEKKKRKRKKKKKSGDDDESENEADNIEVLLVGQQRDLERDLEEDLGNKMDFAASTAPDKSLSEKTENLPNHQRPNFEDAEAEGDQNNPKGRRDIRRLFSKLQEETKIAAILEAERRERVKRERQRHLVTLETNDVTGQTVCTRMVLAQRGDEVDETGQTQSIDVDPDLLKYLKPHQVEAVEFMWDSLIESMAMLNKVNDAQGAGCLLAHCMGLGKTLSVITLLQTLLSHDDIGFTSCLIISPLNAVLNWVSEWQKWVRKDVRPLVYDLVTRVNNHERADTLKEWDKTGGVLVIGYPLFRILASYRGRSRKLKDVITKTLINPGPDVVVCDEGHMLKNDAAAISKSVNRIRTKRRIVLTGTPLQNNLIEYHCMVSFVRPNLLGSRLEFLNRFVNPITNGQHADSTSSDVRLMKRRAHVLHDMLTGVVHRKDYSVLMKFLPPKHEYVLSVRLSPIQIKLYEKYLRETRGILQNAEGTVSRPGHISGSGLFKDYQNLMRVWTHPWLLMLEQHRQDKKPLKYDDEDDDEFESVVCTSSEEEVEDVEETEEEEDEEQEMEQEEEEEKQEEETGKKKNSSPPACRETTEDVLRDLYSSSLPYLLGLHEQEEEKEGEDEEEEEMGSDVVEENGKEEEEEIVGEEGTKTVKMEKKETGKKNGREEVIQKETNAKVVSREVKVMAGEAKVVSREVKVAAGEVKVVAGEVIRKWQTRSKGPVAAEAEELMQLPLNKRLDTWWSSLLDDDDEYRLELSGKLILLFQIIKMAQQIGDKVLVFSQSILSLDMIENFLRQISEETVREFDEADDVSSSDDLNLWIKDEDYVRMDGTTGAIARKRFTSNFNDPDNNRLRLFLISTKAGGLGINLDRANRVIIFDASWNPSNDVQSIFRVYRFGQVKPVFIYRFLAQGTMEEKIYDRQVTKETLSQRVIDEHQIDRHFTAADLTELYVFKPERLDDEACKKRPLPSMPKDTILAELLSTHGDWIVEYHDHDSLLENRPEENLSEEERKSAWEEFEKEKQGFVYNSGGAAATSNGFTRSSFPVPSSQQQRFYLAAPKPPVYYGRNAPTASDSKNVTKQNSAVVFKGDAITDSKVARFSDNVVELVMQRIPFHLQSRIDFQSAHLPRVIQEILKYNPNITISNLQRRIEAFLGIHSDATTESTTTGKYASLTGEPLS